MTNKRKILFVVEGQREKEELKRNIINHLNLNIEDCNIVIYGTSIHELCDLLSKKENEDISLSSILIKRKLINVETNVQLDSTFMSVYLIFDFDPQYQKYNKNELIKIVERFDNETEEGLLLLNYPMFESLFDIDNLDDLKHYLNKKIGIIHSDDYKKLVNKTTCFKSTKGNVFKHIDSKMTFAKIANFNLKKYENILGIQQYYGVDQKRLLDVQLKSLNETNKFYVINTMALLYFDYN